MGDAATGGLSGGHPAASGRARHGGLAGDDGGDLVFPVPARAGPRGAAGDQAEGIRWLKYGFDLQPLYLPLTQLALGRTYEAAGQRDSAAVAYGRFLRFWDKADPELQGRVREAREALQELSGERAGSPQIDEVEFCFSLVVVTWRFQSTRSRTVPDIVYDPGITWCWCVD